jgi:hypothetical protein
MVRMNAYPARRGRQRALYVSPKCYGSSRGWAGCEAVPAHFEAGFQQAQRRPSATERTIFGRKPGRPGGPEAQLNRTPMAWLVEGRSVGLYVPLLCKFNHGVEPNDVVCHIHPPTVSSGFTLRELPPAVHTSPTHPRVLNLANLAPTLDCGPQLWARTGAVRAAL